MSVPSAAEKSSAEPRDALPIAPGSRPEGARDEREAGARVREMFRHIAPRYDFLNHLLSLSFDRLWRRRTAKRFSAILARCDARVLDLCCGTGDLAFALSRRAEELRVASDSRGLIAGSDFAIPMVALAAAKRRAARCSPAFLAGDALSLPFADASFDLVTAGFGFRNLANYQRGLREIARVLKPGGEVGYWNFRIRGTGSERQLFDFISGIFCRGSAGRFPGIPWLILIFRVRFLSFRRRRSWPSGWSVPDSRMLRLSFGISAAWRYTPEANRHRAARSAIRVAPLSAGAASGAPTDENPVHPSTAMRMSIAIADSDTGRSACATGGSPSRS